jgi:hypothetical protein
MPHWYAADWQPTRLLLETRAAFGIAGNLGGEDLERDLAPELGVAGTVHLAHATFAEESRDVVVGEVLPIKRVSEA